MDALRRLLAGTGQPLGWSLVAIMATSAVLAGVLGSAVFGHKGILLSVLAGMLLGSIASLPYHRIALRLIVIEAGLLILAVAAAVVFHGHPIPGALFMSLLAFVCAAWTRLPVIGPLISAYPVLLYILILARESTFVGDGSVLRATGATCAGAIAAVAVVCARLAANPGGARRTLVAESWQPSTPLDAHAGISRVLLLDGAPRVLQVVAAQGSLTALVRAYLKRRFPAADIDPRMALADANSKAIAAAMSPRGHPTPRSVKLDTAGVEPPPPGTDSHGSKKDVAWHLIVESQQSAASLLSGRTASPGWQVRPLLGIARAMLTAFIRPDSSVFRYAVQRSVALGFGALAIGLTNPDQSAYWITLTMAAVLQASAPTTTARVAQRAAGTFAGVLVALALSAMLPKAVLLPWITLILLAVALLWTRRNYAIQNIFMAATMVLIYGAPTSRVGAFAALRAFDVVVGGILALVVVRVLLPVRPRPAARADEYGQRLRHLAATLATRVRENQTLSVAELASEMSDCDVCRSNFATDIALLPEKEQPTQKDLAAELDICSQNLLVVATVVAGLADVPTWGSWAILDTIEAVDQRVQGLVDAEPRTIPG